MKILLITQARYGSSRFPGKVLQKIADGTMLSLHLRRLKRARLPTHFLVATTMEPEAAAIAEEARQAGFLGYRGSTQDVLDRFYQAAAGMGVDHVVRVTSDCPLNDGSMVDRVVKAHLDGGADYTSNIAPPTFADGLDTEVFTFKALEKAWREAQHPFEREHVTPFLRDPAHGFAILNVTQSRDDSGLRMTVDLPEDLQLVEKLLERHGPDAPWEDYVRSLREDASLRALNHHHERNQGSMRG